MFMVFSFNSGSAEIQHTIIRLSMNRIKTALYVQSDYNTVNTVNLNILPFDDIYLDVFALQWL